MVSHVRTVQQVIAYDVRYRLDGRLGQVRMEHHPGKRIPVRDGELVIVAPKPQGATKEGEKGKG
jgi:uncharacterized protein YcfJ